MKEIDIKKIIQKEIAPLIIGIRNDLADNQKALENISEEVKKKSVLEYELEVDDLDYKGEKGDTPIKDIDYPSHDSLFSYIKENLPKKAKDLFTDIDIKNIAIEASKLIDKPEDGINGTDGVNGKDVDYTLVKELIKLKENAIKKEIDKLTIEIYKELKKDKTLSATEIRDSLESLKGSQRLDAKAIKGLEKYVQTFISTQTGGGGGGSTGGLTNPVDYIQFNTSATPQPNAEGLLQWNATDETLDLGMPDDITLQIGQEQQIKARNNTGATILNGQAVYISGSLGNRPTVALARGDAHSTSIVIGVATQDIPDNSDGKITTQGYVRNIDTSAFTEGDMLWLSKTVAGGFVNTEPAVPHHSSVVATVTRSHGVQGTILVNITHHSSLEHLSDVNGTPLTTTGQIPSWNQTAGYFDFDRNILTRTVELSGDFRSYYQFSPYKIMLNMENATNFPNGIEINSIYVNCGTVDPTTELSAKIVYCDAQGTGAFPSTNPTDVATISTTTGNYSQTGMTANVGTGKIVYLEMTANPTDYLTLWTIKINFTIL